MVFSAGLVRGITKRTLALFSFFGRVILDQLMSGASRIVSFVIGLAVLILLFILIANRFNTNRKTAVNIAASTATPTVALTVGPVNSTATPSGSSPGPSPQKSGGWNPFGWFRRSTPTPTLNPVAQSLTPTLTFAQQMNNTMGSVNGAATQTGSQAGNPTPGNQQQSTANVGDQRQQALNGVQTIPKTGTPTLVIPLAAIGLTLGMWLRRR